MSDDAVAADARPSPLHDEHVALGATLVPFAGWSMPLRYGSDLAEHTAVRTAAGLFDLSHMAEIWVLGPDAGAFLDYALVGSFARHGRRPGAVHDDLRGVRCGARRPDRLPHRRRGVPRGGQRGQPRPGAGGAQRARRGPRRHRRGPHGHHRADRGPGPAGAGDPARRRPAWRSRAWPTCATTPRSRATFDVGGHAAARAGRPHRLHRRGRLRAVRRRRHGGRAAVACAARRPASRSAWCPAGLAARDSLRLEAGMPLYGHELDLTVTPYAAGLGRVVKLDKTDADGAPLDFVGRAALYARAHSAPARVLVGLVGESRRAARQGYDVTTRGGTHVGHVTSGRAVADPRRADRDGLRHARGLRRGHRARGGRARPARAGARGAAALLPSSVTPVRRRVP